MDTRKLYHAPADCPVCGDNLVTTSKGCLTCGTQIAGEFASCEFCALGEADLDLLKVFLSSRGNLREVEKFLQVSYPTARARLDAVLVKLGLAPAGAVAEPADEPAAADAEPSEYGDEHVVAETPEQQILARVARGEISPEVAAQLLA
ncbi:DUF2089 domain-containing protein [Tessaracoccus palaemonis]|uniref:DUF2089 domain-containing protein n=1 Tax=Tessaracoccus palaemonis TaxID=2829499 RepID=A0ABX8SKT5_9ACTN|nr:DUF2089 domain-containing protein [Tessaracoccus palaemonis]QXT63499.1 DUF2089 domain-containing protein [Tessaracoccus palaemonis]